VRRYSKAFAIIHFTICIACLLVGAVGYQNWGMLLVAVSALWGIWHVIQLEAP
jgi:hypothetical protein